MRAMATEDSRNVANLKDYTDGFRHLIRNRREQEEVWVGNDLVPKVQSVFVQDTPTPKTEFKILSVGSNEGSFDRLFLRALFSHAKELMEGREVCYTVVEPDLIALNEFKHKITTEDAAFQNVRFRWVNNSMQEFLKITEPERYDVIHFVHCIYYADNEEETLRTAYERFLASPGCILIAASTKNNIWFHLKASFNTKIPSMEYVVPTNVGLSEIGKRNGWAHEIFDAKLDLEVTEVFDERDPVGQAILKYFFHINEKPKEKFGEELMAEVMELFGRISWEKMKDGKKRLFVNEDEGILLIYKHC